MDGWTDVYTDPKGVKRCSRCKHVRPIQPPEDLSNSTQHPLNEETQAARATALQQKAQQTLLEARRRELALQGLL